MKEKNISIWTDIKQKNICPSLENNLNCDVLIVGGGITGLTTAYHLIDSRLNICLIERNEVAHGVSSKTTGKITYLQDNLLTKISKTHNKETAKHYLESQIEAMNIITKIIDKEKMDCNLEMVASYVYSIKPNLKIYKDEYLINDLGYPTLNNLSLPNNKKVLHSYYVNDTYVFHPVKYLYSLKRICQKNKISIYENTTLYSINYENNKYICKVNNHTITAKYIVLAMHYPYFLFPLLLPLKTSIEKSYIKATKTPTNFYFSAITHTKPTISLRYHTDNDKTYKIYLNNSHNTGFKFNYDSNFKDLLFQDDTPADYVWSNKDIITNDNLPYIGTIQDNLLIGTGYNTWGMTNGTIAGKIIADIITNKPNKYKDLFSPQRNINFKTILKFPISLAATTCSFVNTKITKNKNWYPDNVRFEKKNGKNIAIYTDENKKEHIVYNICPHLKCSLLFNNVEKTWDCPCHGSRFDIDGNTIEGPSNYNITYKD